MTGRSCNLLVHSRPTHPRIIRRRNVFIITDKRAIFDRTTKKKKRKWHEKYNKYIYPPFNLDITITSLHRYSFSQIPPTRAHIFRNRAVLLSWIARSKLIENLLDPRRTTNRFESERNPLYRVETTTTAVNISTILFIFHTAVNTNEGGRERTS